MLRWLTKADYLLRETLLGLQRGGWMNWAAISTVTVLLFLFGISLQASWHVENLLYDFGSQLEVSVYLEPGVTANIVEPTVQALPNVMGITVISKQDAWETLVKEMGISDISGATEQLNGNPLVDELKVKAIDSDSVPVLAEQLAVLEGVEAVSYVDEAVKRIAQLNQGLNWVSLAVTSVLTLTAIAVITTTIRLIVMARRQEIEVMQLVGATRLWIYFPFILQGITFGISGAAIAWGLIWGLQFSLKQLMAQQPDFIQFLVNDFQLDAQKTILLPLILFGLGSSVGIMGSLLAVRRLSLK